MRSQYQSLDELYAGLTRYFHYYTTQRPHQKLGYKTPEKVYAQGVGESEVVLC